MRESDKSLLASGSTYERLFLILTKTAVDLYLLTKYSLYLQRRVSKLSQVICGCFSRSKIQVVDVSSPTKTFVYGWDKLFI